MIFLNFKNYPQTTDQNAIKLCRLIKKISSTTSVKIIPCLQASDLYQANQAVSIDLWTQHVDPIKLNKYKKDGAAGTLLNHSQHPVDLAVIKKTLKLCHQEKLQVMVITDTIELIKQVTILNPDYIGFEDPKLIGGPIPMIEAHPDLIKQAIAASHHPLIIGGGMRTAAHVNQAITLGAAGVLVASEFAKSSNPQATLKNLISGFK